MRTYIDAKSLIKELSHSDIREMYEDGRIDFMHKKYVDALLANKNARPIMYYKWAVTMLLKKNSGASEQDINVALESAMQELLNIYGVLLNDIDEAEIVGYLQQAIGEDKISSFRNHGVVSMLNYYPDANTNALTSCSILVREKNLAPVDGQLSIDDITPQPGQE